MITDVFFTVIMAAIPINVMTFNIVIIRLSFLLSFQLLLFHCYYWHHHCNSGLKFSHTKILLTQWPVLSVSPYYDYYHHLSYHYCSHHHPYLCHHHHHHATTLHSTILTITIIQLLSIVVIITIISIMTTAVATISPAIKKYQSLIEFFPGNLTRPWFWLKEEKEFFLKFRIFK